jgi:hypothetical protein
VAPREGLGEAGQLREEGWKQLHLKEGYDDTVQPALAGWPNLEVVGPLRRKSPMTVDLQKAA